ncbi:MAG: GDSL-type esterase/lipase family protein [Chloroflexi bacterium]|nr:GDSL-type esterase/lipase family protein [Chloroflexota bacterium]
MAADRTLCSRRSPGGGYHRFMHTMRRTVVCFGDSITASGWPEAAQAILEENGLAALCINAGVRGNTTAQAMRRLQRDVLQRDPAVVMVEFGFNDCNQVLNSRRPRVAPAEFRANLRAILQQIGSAGAWPALIANHHTLDRRVLSDGRLYDVHSQEYTAITAEVADEARVPLLDLRSLFPSQGLTLREALAEDGIHLSPAGVEDYARTAAAFLLSNFAPLLRS